MPRFGKATTMADKTYCTNHHTGLQGLLEDGLFADLTIICGEERIPVHKAILCAQSSFFKSACTLDMQEKKEGIIRLNDDVNVIRCFIDFCYGGSYDKEKRSEGVSEVLHHAMVYTTAIFCDNHDLQALATERFTSAGEAKEMVWTTTDKNSLEIIRRVFCNTSSRCDPLRMALITLLQKRTLDLGDEEALHKLTADVPDLGAAYMISDAAEVRVRDKSLLAQVKDEIRSTQRYKCNHCAYMCRLPPRLGGPRHCPYCNKKGLHTEHGLDDLAAFLDV